MFHFKKISFRQYLIQLQESAAASWQVFSSLYTPDVFPMYPQ